MAVFAWTSALVFTIFALLQLNDPDPLGWTAIYAITAVLWASAARDKVPRWICAVVAVIAVAWMFTLLPGFTDWIRVGSFAQLFGSLSMDKPYIEESREFLGLALILASTAYLEISTRRRERR